MKSKIMLFAGSLLLIFITVFSTLLGVFYYSLQITEDAEKAFLGFVESVNAKEFRQASTYLKSDFGEECEFSINDPRYITMNIAITSYCRANEEILDNAALVNNFENYLKFSPYDTLIIEKANAFGLIIIPWNNRVRVGDTVTFYGTFGFGEKNNKKDIKVVVEKDGAKWRIGELRIMN